MLPGYSRGDCAVGCVKVDFEYIFSRQARVRETFRKRGLRYSGHTRTFIIATLLPTVKTLLMTNDHLYADLEIRIFGLEDEGYPVELSLADGPDFPRGYLDPVALPLLSHALLETWKRREGRMLTFAGYYGSGRV